MSAHSGKALWRLFLMYLVTSPTQCNLPVPETDCSIPDWFIGYGPTYQDDFFDTSNFNSVEYHNTSLYAGGTYYRGNYYVYPLGAAVDSITLTGPVSLTVTMYSSSDGGSYFSSDPGSGIYVRFVTSASSTFTEVNDLINEIYHLDDDSPFPQFSAESVFVATFHCLTHSAMSERSTFQFVLATGNDDAYMLFNYAEVHDDPSACFPLMAGFTLGATPYHIIPDPYYRYDPRYYTEMTNALHPGQWVVHLSPLVPLWLPTVDPWSPYRCYPCGGCGIRTRVVNGVREYEIGPCGSPIQCTAYNRITWQKSPRGRRIRRKRLCCYDFSTTNSPELSRPRYCAYVAGFDSTLPPYINTCT